jgi:polar amino acid transport system substrate-binding protein
MRTAIVRFCTAAAIYLALSSFACAEIRFGMAPEPYPPFASKNASGRWVGWEIELMDAVCRAMNEKCSIVEVAWDGIIPALQAKQIDVIWNSMSITDKRKEVIDFTDRYYLMPTGVVGAKDKQFTPSPTDMKGKAIGAQVSTTHQDYVEKYYVPAGATLKTYQTQDEAMQDLAAGRVDAVLADSLSIQDFLKTEQGKICCSLKGEPPLDTKLQGEGAGGGVRKSDQDLKSRLNDAIRKVRESGEYVAISKNYFDFDVYGN